MPFDPGGVTPKELQVIKMAGLFVKDVYDDITIVQQYPSGLPVTFYGKPADTFLFSLFYNFIGDCL